MKFESHSQIRRELVQLKKLYRLGIFSFNSTENFLSYQFQNRKIDRDAPLSIRSFKFEETAGEIKSYLTKHSGEYLRELIFIRLISALEAYFVDTLRDVFIQTPEPFRKMDSRIDFSVGEILSYRSLDDLQNKILNRDRRNLNSGGLGETEKYYRKVFSIDLANFGVRYQEIKENYDRRHLFVHSLGTSEDGVSVLAKTDEAYRIKYNTGLKELNVSEQYLEKAFENIEKISDYIDSQLNLRIAMPQWQSRINLDEEKSKMSLVLQIIDNGIPELDPDYKFRVGDNVYTLKSVLESRIVSEDSVELRLIGWEGVLSRYYRLLKKVKLAGKISSIKASMDGREWER